MQIKVAHTAGAVLIGNELLSGKVHESNLIELARTLRALGIALRRVVMVSDEIPEIAAEVRAQTQAFDVVFTSGGVGPTHDDVTIDAIAAAYRPAPCLRPHPRSSGRRSCTETSGSCQAYPKSFE
jgi:molybdenum cofactor synthesis domain-containing protein